MIYNYKRYGTAGILLIVFLTISVLPVLAQEIKTITLPEAIQSGLKNSKVLALSRTKIEQAVTKYNQAKDSALPTGSASYMYNHAEILTPTVKLSDEAKPLELPQRAEAIVGMLSLQEVVFGGNRLRYAKESTRLLTETARLDADKDKEEIVYGIIQAYYNLYKIQQSQKVIEQNRHAVVQQVKQAEQFFEQGLVTKNDVLRFQLQESNIQLSAIDLETNRKIAVYNLDILLGYPENTDLKANEPAYVPQLLSKTTYIDSALTQRKEVQSLALQNQAADVQIKSIRAENLPILALGANFYYINPSGSFIPPANQYIAPATIGATLSWNFDRLWMNKNKIAEAEIEKSQTLIHKNILTDQVKSEVNSNYQHYLQAAAKIEILETAVAQARENDRIMESKYQNNIATVTDRLDAQVQLYQAMINLELARADAGVAYYTLLKSTGTVTSTINR